MPIELVLLSLKSFGERQTLLYVLGIILEIRIHLMRGGEAEVEGETDNQTGKS